MTGHREGQTGRERESQSGTDRARAAFSEKVRRAYENNAQKLLRIYDVYEMPVGFSIHLKAQGFMDLVIERLDRLRISLTHYGQQNGDLMADPDMEVELAADRSWIRPLSYQNDYAGVYQTIEGNPSPALERDLAEFLTMWLKNLGEQGFGNPTPEEAARRKADFEAYLKKRLDDLDALRGGHPPERERERDRQPGE